MAEMTDRELLGLAAKAALISVTWNESAECFYHEPRSIRWADKLWWNPLLDDGDALRLAVKLRMEANFTHPDQQCAYAVNPATLGMIREVETGGADQFAAARRAIVRAAAAIGKAKP